MKILSRFLPCLALLLVLSSCQTAPKASDRDRAALAAAIAAEPLGNYFVGRRYFKRDYKFWGYVRKPRQPWSEARMVMFNENRCLAPDREQWRIGYDNGTEYKLIGSFTGDTVYEPASNAFYPEFQLIGYELRSTKPPRIFANANDALNPSRRVIAQPR